METYNYERRTEPYDKMTLYTNIRYLSLIV